jgi:hypothetical protein
VIVVGARKEERMDLNFRRENLHKDILYHISLLETVEYWKETDR